MEVHSVLGPGLLESAYETCLCHELFRSDIPFRRQVGIPVQYKEFALDVGFRLELLVDDAVIVEVKSVDRLLPIHESQLLTYLRVSKRRVGLLINFNVTHLRNGIRRRAY